MTDLIDHIHAVKRIRAGFPSFDISSSVSYMDSQKQRREAHDKAIAEITATMPKVKITERGDMTRVSIAGIRSTSTSGLDGALSNWVAAAYRHLDKGGAA